MSKGLPMASHSKGPWLTAFDDNSNPMGCVYNDETNIALLVHRKDAQLIAAAPELLEACKMALDILEDNDDSLVMPDEIAKLRNAISKAEGNNEGNTGKDK